MYMQKSYTKYAKTIPSHILCKFPTLLAPSSVSGSVLLPKERSGDISVPSLPAFLHLSSVVLDCAEMRK